MKIILFEFNAIWNYTMPCFDELQNDIIMLQLKDTPEECNITRVDVHPDFCGLGQANGGLKRDKGYIAVKNKINEILCQLWGRYTSIGR